MGVADRGSRIKFRRLKPCGLARAFARLAARSASCRAVPLPRNARSTPGGRARGESQQAGARVARLFGRVFPSSSDAVRRQRPGEAGSAARGRGREVRGQNLIGRAASSGGVDPGSGVEAVGCDVRHVGVGSQVDEPGVALRDEVVSERLVELRRAPAEMPAQGLRKRREGMRGREARDDDEADAEPSPQQIARPRLRCEPFRQSLEGDDVVDTERDVGGIERSGAEGLELGDRRGGGVARPGAQCPVDPVAAREMRGRVAPRGRRAGRARRRRQRSSRRERSGEAVRRCLGGRARRFRNDRGASPRP